MEQYFEEITTTTEYDDYEASPLTKTWSVSKSPSLSSSLEVSGDNNNNDNDSGGFDCNICLESVEDPVVTFCGHIYCWPCIYKWLHHSQKPQLPNCPVCKAKISEKTLVPLYGRGKRATESSKKTEGYDIPNRPRRAEYITHQQQRFGDYATEVSPPVLGNYYSSGGDSLHSSYQDYSYNLSGVSSRRMRRRMMEVDRSLSRICFFLFCCMVLCLLLF